MNQKLISFKVIFFLLTFLSFSLNAEDIEEDEKEKVSVNSLIKDYLSSYRMEKFIENSNNSKTIDFKLSDKKPNIFSPDQVTFLLDISDQPYGATGSTHLEIYTPVFHKDKGRIVVGLYNTLAKISSYKIGFRYKFSEKTAYGFQCGKTIDNNFSSLSDINTEGVTSCELEFIGPEIRGRFVQNRNNHIFSREGTFEAETLEGNTLEIDLNLYKNEDVLVSGGIRKWTFIDQGSTFRGGETFFGEVFYNLKDEKILFHGGLFYRSIKRIGDVALQNRIGLGPGARIGFTFRFGKRKVENRSLDFSWTTKDQQLFLVSE